MEFRIEARPDHLRVVAEGPFDAADAVSGIARVMAQCAQDGVRRVLVDARGITTPVSIMHRYDLATRLADGAPPGLRMAVVVRPDNMFSKTLENTAVNLGVDVRTTDSMSEALVHLELQPPAAPA